jgi:hypothetical protein
MDQSEDEVNEVSRFAQDAGAFSLFTTLGGRYPSATVGSIGRLAKK